VVKKWFRYISTVIIFFLFIAQFHRLIYFNLSIIAQDPISIFFFILFIYSISCNERLIASLSVLYPLTIFYLQFIFFPKIPNFTNFSYSIFIILLYYTPIIILCFSNSSLYYIKITIKWGSCASPSLLSTFF